MTSDYRRDHDLTVKNDEFDRLAGSARANIIVAVENFSAHYPLPVASAGETLALKRAFARYLIDSGKASVAGVV